MFFVSRRVSCDLALRLPFKYMAPWTASQMVGWDGWQNQVLFDKTWRRASSVLHTFKFAKSPPDLPENSAQILNWAQR